MTPGKPRTPMTSHEPKPSPHATTTARELIQAVRRTLESAGIEEAPLEADVIVCHVLGVDRTALFAHPERATTDPERRSLDALLARRTTREPLPYILGRRDFFGLSFVVGPAVLVPRPETETLVEEALRWADAPERRGRPLAVADVGTGSGCVAVSLAVHLPHATVHATDTSRAALNVAGENARRHGVAYRVRLVRADLLSSFSGHLDLVVANLPYVPDADIAGLQPEVAWFEPASALRGGPEGTDLLLRLLASAPGVLAPGGAVMLELGPPQRDVLESAARRFFPEGAARIVKDLAGRDRVLVVETGRDPR